VSFGEIDEPALRISRYSRLWGSEGSVNETDDYADDDPLDKVSRIIRQRDIEPLCRFQILHITNPIPGSHRTYARKLMLFIDDQVIRSLRGGMTKPEKKTKSN
jgi:hypothetical protein